MTASRLLVFVAVWLGAVLSVGCASTATGASSSAMLTGQPPVALNVAAPTGGALVVVRYPAVVEADAEPFYYEAFAASPIGGRVDGNVMGSLETEQIADGVVVKSNYFALSLYASLRERLPEHTVLLSPHAISIDANDKLISTPVTDAESIPSVITLDFATYSFPDSDKMMSSEPLTFGDLFTPLVVAHTDHRARAPTHGLLLASENLMGYASGAAHGEAMTSLEGLQQGSFDAGVRPHDFVTFLNRGARRSAPVQGLSMFTDAHAVQTYPLEKIVLDRAALTQMRLGKPGADPLERVFSDALADRVVAMLNTLDVDKAAMIDRAASINRFDPSLAALSMVNSEAGDVQTRLRFAERMLEAERKFLGVQSEKIYEGIIEGEMGAQVREMLMAEYKVLEQRRELARQQNQATALAVVGVVAAVGVAAASGGDGDFADYVVADILTDVATVSAVRAFALNSESKAVGTNFLQAMVPALDEQISVQVDFLDSNETITAIRFEDFRGMLTQRYGESQRDMDSVGGSCGFAHRAPSMIGTWQGECNGGVADGAGAGVVRREDGVLVEYFGAAVAGRPDGVGYMIQHRDDGAFALEGAFVNGRADGVMRVSQAGRGDRLVMYRAGEAVGPAPVGADAPRLFAPAPQPVQVAGSAS